jgi:hypothetical protein
MAFVEKIHLRAEGGAGFFIVEIGEKGIVVGVEDAAGVQLFGQDFGQGGFSDANRAFYDDVARWFESWVAHGARL